MLTSRGRGLFAAGCVLAVVSWLTQAVEFLVLAVPAVFLPLFAWAWSRVPFQVGVQRWIEPTTVVRGEPCIGALAITNRSSRRSPALQVLDRRSGTDVVAPVPRLEPGAVHPTTYHLATDRRGVYPLGPLTVLRRDVFGLAETKLDLGGRMTLSVHPKHHHLENLPGGVRASLEGNVEQIPFGSSVFNGLREYVVGDDHRHIHWMSTARTSEPQIRVYRDSSVPTITVLLEDRASRYGGDRFEDAVEVVASVVDLALRNDLSVVVTTTGGDSCGSVGEVVDPLDMFNFLAGVQVHVGEEHASYEMLGAGTTLIVVCGQTRDDQAALAKLKVSSARMTVCALVADEETVAVPLGASLLVTPSAELFPERWEEATR